MFIRPSGLLNLAAAAGFSAALLATAAPSQAADRRFGDRVAPLTSKVNFLVDIPLRNEAALRNLVALQSDPESPIYRHFITPDQFRAMYGAEPAAVSRVVNVLRAHGFSVSSTGTQVLEAGGSADAVQRAFGIRLGMRTDDRGTQFGTFDAVRQPSDLAQLGVDVIGLNAIPRPQPQSHRIRDNRYFTDGPYWFDDLKQAYSYPSSLKIDGAVSGTRVKIVTVGDSDYSLADAQEYFGYEGLGPGEITNTPQLSKLLFNPYNGFNQANGASGEANLDVQQAGGSAIGADIIGAAAPNNVSENFLVVYQYLVDKKLGDIISTSYGICELTYTAGYNNGTSQLAILNDYDKVFLQGNAIGQTFVVSSGDLSGLPCPPEQYFGPGTGTSYNAIPSVMEHADDPNVTAVGGTNLLTSLPASSGISQYVSESAFYDSVGKDDKYGTGNYIANEEWGSGSGVSNLFYRPSYQNGFSSGAGRSIPDVSMNMGACLSTQWNCNNPQAGSTDIEYVAGSQEQVGGTSAAAPEFAGLLALWVVATGKDLGNINPTMYARAKNNATLHDFHDDIPGSNGVVSVPSGNTLYSQVTGLGSPIGVNLIGVPNDPVAGNPRSSTNP